MVDLPPYVIAAVLHHISNNTNSPFLRAQTHVGLNNNLNTTYNSKVKDDIVIQALETLEELGIATRISDPFTADFFQVNEVEADAYFEAQAAIDGSVFAKANAIGASFFQQALSAIAKLSDEGDYSKTVFIPASDRLVRISDNHDYYVEVDELIDETIKAVETNNEVGEVLADDRDRISAELKSGKELIRGSTIRLRALFEILIKPLRFIAQKFSESALGETAKKLIQLLFEAL